MSSSFTTPCINLLKLCFVEENDLLKEEKLLFQDFIFNYVYICIHGGMCTWVQVPVETIREYQIPMEWEL